MPGPPITRFDADPECLAVIRECMESYDVGAADAEWPNNLISRKAVVYASGVIARAGGPVRHNVDPDELALCRRLAADAAAVMDGVAVGMGSESTDPFRPFFITANVGEPPPRRIDEALIRARFGGTIFPPATITVEPLAEAGVWWSEVQADSGEDGVDEDEEMDVDVDVDVDEDQEDDEDSNGGGDDLLKPWREMIRWFARQPGFVDRAFVRIGDRQALWDLPRQQWPEGTEVTGSVLPRMALGLTPRGSLVGLFGYSVQT